MQHSPLDEKIKAFLISLSKTLGVRIEKILDLYLYVSPNTVKIIEVIERGGEIVGVRLAVRSKRREDLWYYVAVGQYGAKCTCEGNTLGGKTCRHIIIGTIMWNMISLLKKEKSIDLSTLTWLTTDKNF